MYSVVIVDDEKLVIESLKRIGVWGDEGFEVTGQARNGIEAYQLISELKPDVVFTDIRMPAVSGLELMTNTAGMQDRPLFVIISGFPEFAYAQKAMSLGAIGYCLKPFDPGEIGNILKTVRQKLDRSREEYALQLADVLNEAGPVDELQLAGVLKKLKMEMDESNPLVAVTIIGPNIPLGMDGMQHVIFKAGARKRILLVKGCTPQQCLEYFRQIHAEGIDGIGISRPAKTPGQLAAALEESETAAHQYFIYGRGHISLSLNESAGKIKSMIAEFTEGIGKNDITELDEIFSRVEKEFARENGQIRHAYLLYICVMGRVFGKISEEEDFVFTYQQMVYYYGDFGKMLRELKGNLLKRLQSPENEDMVDNGGIIDETLRLIRTNFFKDISIQSIARDFRINPSYFCSLFKKKTGTTFTAYLNKCRIAYASELLKTSGLPIGEIAEKSGYDNFYYFSKLFKSMTGMTPSHFRTAETSAGHERQR